MGPAGVFLHSTHFQRTQARCTQSRFRFIFPRVGDFIFTCMHLETVTRVSNCLAQTLDKHRGSKIPI